MRFWNLFISLWSSLKIENPYYLAPPCIYKWNGKNIYNDKLNLKNKNDI